MTGDREHIAQLRPDEKDKLAEWLARPNGSCLFGQVTFEAVGDGGIWVRTAPWRGEPASAVSYARAVLEAFQEDRLARLRERQRENADDLDAQFAEVGFIGSLRNVIRVLKGEG